MLHTMAWFYVIYRFLISEWRSIRPVEINQYDITMATNYDITMGNDIAQDAHCEITMGNGIAWDIHCDITMSDDFAMCTNLSITMHNDVAMNLFYCVFSVLCLIMISLWVHVVCNKKKEQVYVWSVWVGKHIRCFCVGLFHSSFGLLKYTYTNITHVFSPDWSNTN